MAGYELVYQEGLLGIEKWQLLGSASVLLHPTQNNAAPRLPLEAAMVGTPTVCLAGDGTEYHVKDGVSGVVCKTVDDLPDAIMAASKIDPDDCLDFVHVEHTYQAMIDNYLTLLTAVAEGETW
jgi:glycosyltransferase involved in cell wall biosynthesis